MRFEWRGVVESRLYYFSGRRAWREKTRKARREILESRVFCLLVVFLRVRFLFFWFPLFFCVVLVGRILVSVKAMLESRVAVCFR